MSRPKPDLRFMKLHVAALLVAVLSATATPVAVAQTFVSQGPGISIGPSLTAQSNDAPPNGTVGAAIQAVLPHPTDPNTMYVGGTNGGIWATRNGGASWTPLSDKQRSLSIASLAFYPTDPSRGTLIAGVGITSNGLTGGGNVRGRGGERIGVLYSSNGGASWNELGGTALANKSIVGVAARGSTLLAAAAGAALCGGGRRALPQRQRRRLVRPGERHARPGERPGVVIGGRRRQPQRLLRRRERHRHLQEQQRWRRLVAGPVAGANRIARVATGPNGSIAVGIYQLERQPDQRQAGGDPHSRDGGASWVPLAVPQINFGGQASTDFAIAVDPVNPDIVYVAGDRIADVPFTVTAYRIVRRADGTSVAETLTDQGTSDGSTTHADARTLVVRRAGAIDPGR